MNRPFESLLLSPPEAGMAWVDTVVASAGDRVTFRTASWDQMSFNSFQSRTSFKHSPLPNYFSTFYYLEQNTQIQFFGFMLIYGFPKIGPA